MIELLILIAGLVCIWKFSSAFNAIATSARVHAEVFSEKVSTSAVKDRTDIFETFEKDMKDRTIYSHSEIMSKLKLD